MTKPIRYCLALDLKNDETLINQYIEFHKPENTWPQITKNMLENNILDMEIYRTGDRLFMIMEVSKDFDPNKSASSAEGQLKENEWQTLMWKFQKPLAWAKPGEKWVKMEKIYDLKDTL